MAEIATLQSQTLVQRKWGGLLQQVDTLEQQAGIVQKVRLVL